MRLLGHIVGVLVLGGAISIGALALYDVRTDDTVRVVFLDVGQGDAILITQGARQILIDGGADGQRLLEALARYMPVWDRVVDVVIATHPDADHIGAQVAVLRTLRVGTVISTNAFKTSRVATAWHSALTQSRAEVVMADQYVSVDMVQGAPEYGQLRVLFPRRETQVRNIRNVNDTSIVTEYTIGQTVFWFTGDLSTAQERNLPARDITVLKVGHHGSDTSTSVALLERTHPKEAVISVGRNNRYGHPHEAVINRLTQYGITTVRTDERGDIIYTCRADVPCTRTTQR